MPKKGYKQTEEHKRKSGLSRRGLVRSPEHCHNLSIALKGHPVSDETARKISIANSGRIMPEEQKEKIREWNRIHGNSFKGKQHAKNSKREMAIKKFKVFIPKDELEYLYWSLELTAKKIGELYGISIGCVTNLMNFNDIPHRTPSEIAKRVEHTPEWNRKMRQSLKGRVITQYTRDILSRKMYERLDNPIYVNKLIKGLNLKPNKQELKLQNLIDIACPNEYKFTGDGAIRIERCWPDFTNCNGKKKIIEFYGEHWHKPEEEEIRIKKFGKYGFDTLIIWERELKEENKVIEKIRKFTS